MKNLTFVVISASALMLTVGCKKKGDFTTDKAVYVQGEVITVTNTTEKPAKFYTWTFGDVVVEGENPVYTLPEDTPVGEFSVSVLPRNVAMNDSWKRTTMSVTIVEAEEAQMLFYLPSPRTGSSDETYSVVIDGVTQNGAVGNYPLGAPIASASSPDAARFIEQASGDYSYTISGTSSSGSYTLTGTVTLENGFSYETVNVTNL